MIVIAMNKKGFEYDVHSLVKAFYMNRTVHIQIVGETDQAQSSAEGLPDILIEFAADAITLLMISGKSGGTACRKITLDKSMERSEVKSRLKLLLYHCLTAETGKSLPWGTLTGIRPAKIPLSLLEADELITDAQILQYMQDHFCVSREKAELAIDIARREEKILTQIDYRQSYSIYIGIPFCPTTCLYCSFTSYPIARYQDKTDQYLEVLLRELAYVVKARQGQTPTTIYIGGGTPTTLSATQLQRLLSELEAAFNLSGVREFTVEAGRADSITEEKLQVMKAFGVNRISINPQTMNSESLAAIGRRHTVEQVREAFYMARRIGFHNINMDLILGLPGESEKSVAQTMAQIKELCPDSITLHSLAVKRGSRLHEEILQNGRAESTDITAMMQIACDSAKSMGMKPYYLYRQKNIAGNLENVGYAAEGKHGLYNILMMEDKQDIIGLGAGTVTKKAAPDGTIARCDTVKDVDIYMTRIDEMICRKEELFQ